MAWNKSLQSESVKAVPYGAPVTTQGGAQQGRGYHDAWDIERAYREGIQKVTWVARAIDAIAGNQARLPMLARKDNSPYGKIVQNEKILDLLNTKSNPGENSFIFRYRLSSQLLISSRGAFVEKIRGRNGDPIALHLLPPQHTSPIPDGRKFVAGYEVTSKDGSRTILSPDDVIWFRHPHPLNPYLSMTPMEAAGIAIEIENLSKFYNRNFLINDGRPGGLLVVRGDMEEEDKEELRSRFRGNVAKAGAVSVIASEDGVEFVDTAASPRDAAYTEMRRITKEEILAAFGVPESIIGNASGRCLRQSELVRLASGERVPAGELVGQHFTLLTSSPEGHVEVPAWATLEQVETIYRITTESGKTLETNGRHPLYAARFTKTKDAHWRSANGPRLDVNGWTPVSALSDGEWVVAVPTVITPTSHNDLSVDEAFVLGALVGDGTMTGNGQQVALSTPKGDFSKAFVAAVERLGDEVVLQASSNRCDSWRVRAKEENRIGSGRGAVNSVRTRVLLREVGLFGTTSHTKFIPEKVFGASNESLAAFLGGLFAADGCVHLGKATEKAKYGSASISLGTVSERLARDVQEALLRFGVHARLRQKSSEGGLPSLKGRIFTSWEVMVSDAESIVNFAASIDVPGKADKLMIASIRSEERLERGRQKGWRTRDLNPGLAWEKIKSVEEVGTDQTIGIMVPEHHTYLSVLWEHNTYANAAEEGKVFWMETMAPHLEMLARGWDALDDEHYFDFDTAGVPILILAKQEREQYLLEEFRTGLITANEYRVGTGRPQVESDLADSMLGNPNAAPIGNTERPMPYVDPAQQQAEQAAAMGAPMPGAPGAPAAPLAEAPMPGEAPVEPAAPPSPEAVAAAQEAGMVQTAGASLTGMSIKSSSDLDDWETKSAQAADRWEQILDRTLERYFERQQRVILEKARGAKSRTKVLDGELDAASLFDAATWDRQLSEDVRPVLAGALRDAVDMATPVGTPPVNTKTAEFEAMIDAQVERVKMINQTTRDDIAAALIMAQAMRQDEDRHGLLIATLVALFVDALSKRKKRIAEIEAQSALNAGTFLAAKSLGASTKTWLTRRDGSVRPEHRVMHGKTVDTQKTFRVGEDTLRFPGDPMAPISLTAGCRCRLRFG